MYVFEGGEWLCDIGQVRCGASSQAKTGEVIPELDLSEEKPVQSTLLGRDARSFGNILQKASTIVQGLSLSANPMADKIYTHPHSQTGFCSYLCLNS